MTNTPEQTRREYIKSFGKTMTEIWKEKINLLQVIHTGALFRSIATAQPHIFDQEATTVTFTFNFLQYGHYQQRGTGREVKIGNGGDIGRQKVRRKKEWFQPKYQGSIHNIREFFAKNLSKESIAIITTTLNTNPRP